MGWTSEERAALKAQAQTAQADIATMTSAYPLREWDPANPAKCLIADRLDRVSRQLTRIIASCDDPNLCIEEKL